ncbi:hypothetical protein HN51_044114 [Arachis hypogaea]|uniref:Transmembrane protein n=1 Tax=Arachis hypogaea TaxID=3818 RepID=A0A444Y422_ARAHY|nr:uncharacterized protein LOC107613880 [Arachis ipaensis]XP_025672635.1 uncharacterized protein LOC112771981 [Arachis hypogaea]QHN96269.1 uncharacterized protein DS421_18g617020 [Arachis hypogaea]RYQ96658.1 hypothetical protein Ahy_B08g092501 [Arachis hypogaea]
MLQFQHCHHQHQHLLLSNPLSLFSHHNNHNPSLFFSSSSSSSMRTPTPTLHSPAALPPPASSWSWLTHLAAELTTAPADQGPIELPFSSTQSIFATTDDPSPIQVASSVLLTGAVSIFLFRALRRRAKRAKELQFRSSGEKKSIKEEALDTLKAMGSSSIEDAKGPPSPVQAFLGGISAGIIALILYKFATTVEAALNRQTISDNYSVRQITITIRTILNGLTYLATFVFGINSVGLFLYSGKLGMDSLMGGSTEKETESKSTDQSSLSNSSVESPTNNTELSSSSKGEQSSNDGQ